MTPMITSKYINSDEVSPRHEKEWIFAASSVIGNQGPLNFEGCCSIIIFNRPSSESEFYSVVEKLGRLDVGSIFSKVSIRR